jgi:hypothetical protein
MAYAGKGGAREEELYDMVKGPNQFTNAAKDPRYADMLREAREARRQDGCRLARQARGRAHRAGRQEQAVEARPAIRWCTVTMAGLCRQIGIAKREWPPHNKKQRNCLPALLLAVAVLSEFS